MFCLKSYEESPYLCWLNPQKITISLDEIIIGWWFGIIVLRIITTTIFFQRGRYTTNQLISLAILSHKRDSYGTSPVASPKTPIHDWLKYSCLMLKFP